MLTARNLSKLYRMYRRPADRLRESLPFSGQRHEEFWALRNVDLEIADGETFGIVGPNGGGKSTLLQILAGILEPTTGRVVRKGRTAALLELGAGFNPEFSGRENVYINGEILGLPRAEIDQKMESIESFAGIGAFIERPVKTYSSGMYVRLAFSTAIHVDPEILIVDEALAVGDAVFANRCVSKFEELKQSGVTIVFVSHDMGLVKQICDRAIFLEGGVVQAAGEPKDVINRYVGTVLAAQKESAASTSEPEDAPDLEASHRHGDGLSKIIDLELLGHDGEPTRTVESGERVSIRVRVAFEEEQPSPMIGILLRTRNGLEVFGTNTSIEEADLPAVAAGEELEVEFDVACALTPQEYTLTVATQHPSGHSQDWLDDAVSFQVLSAKRRAGVADLDVEVRTRSKEKAES